MMISAEKSNSFVTVNPCRLCAPLGASLAFKGIEGAIPLIHGSQGCSTYIRRYLISHFREPIDIASSNFHEETAIFGGWENISHALENLIKQYSPSVIGITTTCLTETIGDNVDLWIHRFINEKGREKLPLIIPVSTPSYKGSHEDGYHAAVEAIVKACASANTTGVDLFLLPPMLSPEDLRRLKDICAAFDIKTQLLPDYSETLDGGIWDSYHPVPEGGTPICAVNGITNTGLIMELGAGNSLRNTGLYLKNTFNGNVVRMSMPVGIRATDRFLDCLSKFTGKPIPERFVKERNRLLDAYVDGHKYVFEKKALVVGDEDTVAAVVSLLSEIGIIPAVCATASGADRLREHITNLCPGLDCSQFTVINEADFDSVGVLSERLKIDLCIGTSKSYHLAVRLGIPLVRAGFPVHDRFGASRFHMVGYAGTLSLYDSIVNALIARRQDTSDVGYSYL